MRLCFLLSLRAARGALLLASLMYVAATPAGAQSTFDASWYDPSQPHVKVAVTQDGVYRLSAADLLALGAPLTGAAPTTLRLFENGREIPLWYEGDASAVSGEASIYFVGRHNRGTDEAWAYLNRPEWQSSTHFSLYSDTTYYWLTWGGSAGKRYDTRTAQPTFGEVTTAFRDTLHLEDESRYYDGDGSDAENPIYTRGEGYYGTRFSHGAVTLPSETGIQLLQPLFSADSLRFRARLNSVTNTRHRFTLELGVAQGETTAFQLADEADWNGYALQTLYGAIAQSDLPASGRLDVRLTSHNEFDAQPNITDLDWYEVSYMREMVAQNGALRASFASPGSRQLVMKGFSSGRVLVLNPGDGVLFEAQAQDGQIAFSHQSTTAPVYWAASPDAVLEPADLQLDATSDWASEANAADYVIITTPALRASAEAMADYHRTANGYTVVIAEVQDLFDQFDYGRPTPIALRRFVHQTQRWRTAPQFLLLWGDTLYPSRTRERQAWDVPSYGKASSDGWYGMQLGGPEDWSEALAIGRIPVRTNVEGGLFVQKLTSYDSRPLEDWQKRGMLMVGGRDAPEQQLLQNFVLPWANRMARPPTGMDTLKFFSNTTDPFGIEGALQDSIRQALRSGVSWLSYFGHSSATVWDIVVDPPQNFDNAGRLPMAISLGCRTGAFGGGSGASNDVRTLAEQLLLSSLNGSIGHWGSSGLGSVSASARFGDLIHQLVFTDTLRTLGPVFQEAKRRYIASGSFSLKELTQFGLMGDPATRLDLPTQPDFVLSEPQLRITPQAPVPADSTLTVAVTLKNRGLVPVDSVSLELLHTAPDGSSTSYALRIAPFALQAEAAFTVPITAAMVGENRFQVEVDPEDAYAEAVEANNVAERTHVVFSTGLVLVAPLEMGAVSSTQPRLRATYVSRDETNLPVLFELDEVPTFDSPAKRTYRTTASGTFAVWQLTEPLTPGQGYFWRARIETEDGLVNWRTASFFVDEQATGNTWLQAGRFFDVNEQDYRLTREEDRWAFSEYGVDVLFSATRFSSSPRLGEFVVDGTRYERGWLGFGMLILDGYSGKVKGYGSMPTYPNSFEEPAAARAELDSLVSLLREGDYVFIRTRHVGRGGGPEIDEDIKSIFRSLGSTAIDTLTYDHAWLLRTRIGAPEETREWVDPPGSPLVDLVQEEVVYFPYPEGITLSPPIGPARTWEHLDWEATLENEASAVYVDVLDAESGAVLLEGLDTPGPTDLSFIDARAHPRLRLRATLSDSTQRSTPQLDRWSVGFSVVPEVVVDGTRFTVSSDTLDEGATLEVSADVINLSDVPTEQVVIRLLLTDAQNQTSLAASDTLETLGAAETATLRFSLNTLGLVGLNTLTLQAEQPGLTERLTFNNTSFAEFTVQRDQVPPELRVSINGTDLPHVPEPVRDLQDPGIPFVSARPTIEIVLSDDNPHQLLSDTSLVQITLNEERIAFARPDVQFEPATAARNEARLLFTPDLSGQDAVYTLQVTAFDATRNEATPYQVHFRVASSFAIGSVYPYPNPMSSFTRFAFLIQGADASLIDDFRIRVYTITGRVVKEFDLVEDPFQLDGGVLRIGWNKLVWDGRDEDGDLLSSGVYLYKVFLRVDGEPVTVNNDSGVEKLVVLR